MNVSGFCDVLLHIENKCIIYYYEFTLGVDVVLSVVDDLLNECECRMSSKDYRACECLLTCLQGTCN